MCILLLSGNVVLAARGTHANNLLNARADAVKLLLGSEVDGFFLRLLLVVSSLRQLGDRLIFV